MVVAVGMVVGVSATSVVGLTVVCTMHDLRLAPEHITPPFSGAGAVQFLVCTPLLHTLQFVHPPFTTETDYDSKSF